LNAGWKAFWIALGTIAAGIVAFLLGRRHGEGVGTGVSSIPSPQAIASQAEIQVQQARTEIKADSDAELAARFNALAKKEKP